MSSVDDRIVNMKFNNSQFGKGVDETKRDLTGLEKTITGVGKSKGMTDLASATEGARVKFSALQVAGVAALGTIVSKATSAGLSMIKSLTISPIMDGFREYQTNLGSIQTIMANTGKGVGEVNKYLGELNKYSDQTIYNFSQMAKNIGTFTAAGVELDTATSAIKGISNLAALSGSTSQQASTAMYQLSQAISAGRVGLQDWNSVVNAGMGGKVFKNALAQTAVAMGGLSANAVKVGTDVEIMGESFRQSISAKPGTEGWLNSKVLVTTLAQLDGRFSKTALAADGYITKQQQMEQMDKSRLELAKEGVRYSDKEYDAMVKKANAAYEAATQIKTATQLFQVVQESIGSMWAQAFQIVLGDFNQSKKLWGEVGDVVMGIIDKISGGFLGALRLWEERGGRMKVIDGLANVFGGLVDIFGAIAKGFDAAFPDSNVSLLNRLSKAFYSITEALVPSKDTLEDIQTIAEGFFSVFHLGFAIVKGVVKGLAAFFGALFGATTGARGGILSLVASIAEVVIAVEGWITSGGKVTKFLKGIGTLAGTALAPLIASIGLLVDVFAALVSGEGLGGAEAAFGRLKDTFGGFVSGIIQGLDQITSPFDKLKGDIADLAAKASGPFQGLIDKLNEVRLAVVHGLGLDTIMPSLDGLRELMNRIQGAFVKFAEGLSLPTISMEKLGDMTDWVVEKFNAMVDAIQNVASNLDISDKLKAAKDAIADVFSGIGGGASSAGGAAGGAVAEKAQATGDAFAKIGDVLSTVGSAIKTILGFLGQAAASIGSTVKGLFPSDALEWATVLNVLLSGAIIKKLLFSRSIFEEAGRAVRLFGSGVRDAFSEVGNTLQTMQASIKAGIILNIAIAVSLLVASLIALSFVPHQKLAQGLASLATVMAMLNLSMKILVKIVEDADAGKMLAVGAAMTLMAAAVLLLATAAIALSFVPWQKLAVGLGAVGILVGIMVIALQKLSGNSAKIAAAGAAMVLMATAVDILVAAVIVLGAIPFSVLEQGLAGMAFGIGIMVMALQALAGNSTKVLAAAGAMVLMATAMNILVSVITVLGLLPWSVVEQGLKAVAIGLGIMVLALGALAGIGAGVLAAGAAMLMIASALNILMSVILVLGATPWDIVSKGLAAMALALLILVGAAGLAMLVLPGLAALSTIITAIGLAFLAAGAGMFLFTTGLAILVTVGVAAIGIITLAIGAFIALLPNIAIQAAAAFVTFIQAIALAAPKLRKAFGTIFKEMIGTVTDAIPEIGKLIQTLIDTCIGILSDSIPQWIELGFQLIDSFMQSMHDHIPNVVANASDMIIQILDELGAHAQEMANAGIDLVVDVINGMSDAIENSSKIRDAAWNLVRTFADEVREAMGELLGAINPVNYLPSISLGDIKGLLPGQGRTTAGAGAGLPPPPGRNGRGGKADTTPMELVTALADAGTVIVNAVKLFTGAMQGPIYDLVLASKEFQNAATRATTVAEARASAADVAEASASDQMDKAKGMKGQAKFKGKGKDQEGRNKKGKAIIEARAAAKAAAKQRVLANQAANQAIKRQQEADFKDQQARDAVTYKDDNAGLGAARAQVGTDLADESAALAAQAKAKVDEAARLEALAAKGGKVAKKYREEAARLRKEAAAETAQSLQLSAQAMTAQAEAVAAYARARADAALSAIKSMEDIRAQQKAQADQRAWDADYAKATDADKVKMLQARIDVNTDKAKTANDLLAAAYAQSDALAAQIASDPNSVSPEQLSAMQKALADAEKAASDASMAMDAVDQDTQTIAQLQEQIKNATSSGGTGGTGSNGSIIQPSRTALEDAALAVDRYTSSVAQAEEMAQAESGPVQFVQNNYSPEALTASEIYRQTKNLTSIVAINHEV